MEAPQKGKNDRDARKKQKEYKKISDDSKNLAILALAYELTINGYQVFFGRGSKKSGARFHYFPINQIYDPSGDLIFDANSILKGLKGQPRTRKIQRILLKFLREELEAIGYEFSLTNSKKGNQRIISIKQSGKELSRDKLENTIGWELFNKLNNFFENNSNKDAVYWLNFESLTQENQSTYVPSSICRKPQDAESQVNQSLRGTMNPASEVDGDQGRINDQPPSCCQINQNQTEVATTNIMSDYRRDQFNYEDQPVENQGFVVPHGVNQVNYEDQPVENQGYDEYGVNQFNHQGQLMGNQGFVVPYGVNQNNYQGQLVENQGYVVPYGVNQVNYEDQPVENQGFDGYGVNQFNYEDQPVENQGFVVPYGVNQNNYEGQLVGNQGFDGYGVNQFNYEDQPVENQGFDGYEVNQANHQGQLMGNQSFVVPYGVNQNNYQDQSSCPVEEKHGN
ncbi:hypothetical protein QTN25_006325 [Entamoeba marina]